MNEHGPDSPHDLIANLSNLLVPETSVEPRELGPLKTLLNVQALISYIDEKLGDEKLKAAAKVIDCILSKIGVLGTRGVEDACSVPGDLVRDNKKRETLQKILDKIRDRLDVSEYEKMIGSLKDIYNEARNEARNNTSLLRPSDVVPEYILDTCYNKKKAERFKNAMKAIEEIAISSRNDIKEELYALLLVMFARMSRDYRYSLDAEWFHLLLHNIAVKKDRNVFFPLCVTRGDVMALYYYIWYKIKEGSISGERNLNIVNAAELIKIIVNNALKLPDTDNTQTG